MSKLPESQTLHEIRDWLLSWEPPWLIRIAASNRRMPTGLRGIGDILGWRGDTHLMIEVKRVGGRRKESQIEFCRQLQAACPGAAHIVYMCVESLAEVQAILQDLGLCELRKEEKR